MKIELRDIVNEVIKVTGLDIRKKTRKREYFHAKQIYYKIAKDLKPMATSRQICAEVNRNHATFYNAMKKLEWDFSIIKDDYEAVKKNLGLALGSSYINNLKSSSIYEGKKQDIILEIVNQLAELTNSDIQEFKDTRLNPYINMLKTKTQ